jgi:DNA-binding NarL/FixJ family response regulator
MVASLANLSSTGRSATVARQKLPARMRVLYVATQQRTGGWLAEAFAGDSASNVVREEAVGRAAGLARLRNDVFDAVLVSHESEELDALDMIEACRASGTDAPIVVLGTESEQEMAALCYEVGADGYLCVHTATTRNLIWVIARAVQRQQLMRDNRRLTLAEQTRLDRERDEAADLLAQRRSLSAGDCSDSRVNENGTIPFYALPAELIGHYRELLRTHVIMGAGNLSVELKCLAELLVAAGLTARETMQLHLDALDELVHRLGSRSARHVMNRADLLALEVLLDVAEGYRLRYQRRIHPPVQQRLPGME